ncbi:3-oxoacyl-[acyl-carrier-protein] reductase [Cyclonatronum proteinivorum]|uniref:3-oxoacyl-[acyl-carrier-protein] reductase n=1 Tax=Cyclonatronum proteinivorum TaxID=1457365 RepID=A0A345UHR1_9BACT|nr:3-oxoacyl-[acyl-carrier-protein] reductase [Cyclonatronum proteinivorum]AXJ00013.1 3-oxoacyl-[acyl-carrier-protein] reductase [Cyclonatronum proteinivorum]
MNRFENKVVLITGGAAGIGKATTELFAAEGASVHIWDLNEAAGTALVTALTEAGQKAAFRKLNVAEYEDVKSGIEAIIAADGKLDVLINNAGITMDKTLVKMDPATWQKVIDVNLTGVFNCTQIAAPYMIEKGTGVILNASSVVGLYGNFGQTNYVATKAGVIGMTKTWSRELGRKGIRVNAVAPGFIATEMVQQMPEKVIEMMVSKVPLGRMGKPEDIAHTYAFLASDHAAYITGTVISVDGGIIS